MVLDASLQTDKRAPVYLSTAEWSDSGAVRGVSAAVFRFGPEGDVPIPTAGRHKPCFCRCVWDPVLAVGFGSGKLLTECVPCSWATLLDGVFDERVRLQEQ